MANPTALGGYIVPEANRVSAHGGVPGDTQAQILAALLALQDRLAPPSFTQRIQLNNLATGLSTIPVNINSPNQRFNAINVNLTQGIVNIYMGGQFLYQVQASVNPEIIYFPPTNISAGITCQTDSASPSAASGIIDIMQY